MSTNFFRWNKKNYFLFNLNWKPPSFFQMNITTTFFLTYWDYLCWKSIFLQWIAWLDREFLWIWHFPSLTSWWCPFLDSSLLLHIFREEHPNVCNFGTSDYRQNNIQCYLVVPGKPFCVIFHSPVVVLLSCFLKAYSTIAM